MKSVDVIIVAAGSGLRYGAPLPKQYCELAGRPVAMHTINAIRQTLPEAHIILVISRDMEPLWHELCIRHHFTSPDIIYGGSTRWESVCNAINDCKSDIIMVHDAVRPLVTDRLVKSLLTTLESDDSVDGAIPAVPVTDSLRIYSNEGRSKSIDRAALRAVQTPQAFRGRLLRKAYTLPYQASFTDDASVMEAAGYDNIVLTEGSSVNIKITNPGDIAVAELFMSNLRT